MGNRRHYWEGIYNSNKENLPGWHQEMPVHSINLINSCNLIKTARILDVGGGDSYLVDHLLNEEYQEISVLDISDIALQRSQDRLGENAKTVEWIAEDITHFESDIKFDLWHDRAAFHFLLSEEDIQFYINRVKNMLDSGSWFILGTFSENGPTRCSGLPIIQYSANKLVDLFGGSFQLIEWFNDDHVTPGGGKQNYIYCRFQRT